MAIGGIDMENQKYEDIHNELSWKRKTPWRLLFYNVYENIYTLSS